jgi:hypothetical protein
MNMNTRSINSTDDLNHPRAREIAQRLGIRANEILPLYLQLEEEVIRCGGELNLDLEDPDLRDIEKSPVRKIACGAIICYELSLEDVLKFPTANAMCIAENLMIIIARMKGVITPAIDSSGYINIAEAYMTLIGSISVQLSC